MKKIGKYEVLGSLGKGSMGVVYKAKDAVLGRLVALKTMLEGVDNDEELVKRFQIEAQAAAQLNHENIITIYDLGQAGDTYYIAMEFLDGQDLKSLINTKKDLSLREKINIILQICYGLQYAHKRGVVHRDIKPANVMMLKTGKIKIMDFGIAHVASSDMTRTGTLIGTPDYMSPEQVRGHRVDSRSDIFSVGVILYEMLTGKKPFHSDTVTTVLYKIAHESIPTFEDLKMELPVELDSIVMKAVKKDVQARYQKIKEMIKDLETVSEMFGEETIKIAPGVREELKKLIDEGKHFQKARDFQKAAEVYNKALAMDPDNTVLQRLIEKVEGELLKTKKKEIDLILEEARRLYEAQKFDEALKQAAKTFSILPDNTAAKILVSEIQQKKADYEKQQLIQTQSKKVASLIKKRKFDEAMDEAKALKRIDTKGHVVAPLIDEIERQRERAQDLAQIDIIMGKAKSLFEQNDFDEAAKMVQAALKIDSDHKEANSFLKKVEDKLLKAGFKEEATIAAESGAAPTIVDPVLPGEAAPTVVASETVLTDTTASTAETVAKTRIERMPKTKDVVTTSKKPSKLPLILTSLAAVAIITVLVVLVVIPKIDREGGQEIPTPVASKTGFLQLNATPWANIESVKNLKDGSLVSVPDSFTPAYLSLPPGEYEISLFYPEFNERKLLKIEINAGETKSKTEKMVTWDTEEFMKEIGLE